MTSSASIIVSRKFGLAPMTPDVMLSSGAFAMHARVVNLMIRHGLALDDALFTGEGLPAVKYFYDHLRKLPRFKQAVTKITLRERARRCAAQLAYFSIREFKLRNQLISQIAGWLLAQENLEVLFNPGFPSRSFLKRVRTELSRKNTDGKRLSYEFLKNQLLHVRNVLKTLLGRLEQDALATALETVKVDEFKPDLAKWLSETKEKLLMRFMRKASTLLTKRVKWLQKNHVKASTSRWMDVVISEILAGKKLSLKSWQLLRKTWRDRQFNILKERIVAIDVEKLVSSATENLAPQLTVSRVLTQAFKPHSRRSRLMGIGEAAFTAFLLAETRSHLEYILISKLKPTLLKLVQVVLNRLGPSPWRWLKRPHFKRQTISFAIDDGQAFNLEAENNEGEVHVTISLKPREHVKFALRTPDRFYGMVERGYAPRQGFLLKKPGGGLVLALPFEKDLSQQPVPSKSTTEDVIAGLDLGLKILGVLSIKKDEEVARHFIDQKQLSGRRDAWYHGHDPEEGFFNFKRRLTNLQLQASRLQAKLKRYANAHPKVYRSRVKYQILRREWKRVWQKLQNLHDEVVRQVATRVVAACQHHGVTVIRVEDLSWAKPSRRTEVGYFLSTWQVHWLYSRIQELIVGRARQEGIHLERVDAKNTSKRCSKCGKLGIRLGKKFTCPHCGSELDSDLNAAREITQAPLSPAARRGRGGRPLPPPH